MTGPLPGIVAASIGLMFGAACGYLIVLGSVLGSREALSYILLPLAGALLGAPFGVVAFPVAYYTLLGHEPMRRIVLGLAYSTVVAGWLGSLVAVPRPGDNAVLFLLKTYGPATLGLMAGALWIRRFREYWWLTPKARNALIAVAVLALLACLVNGLIRHSH